MGSLDRSPERENTLRTKVKTLEYELHNRNCTIANTKCSNPYNVGWEGVFIPPTLLQHSENTPPVIPEVERLHQGYLVISLGRTVRLGYSCPDHMFHDVWQPSERTFGGPCGSSPLSFITSASPAASRRFWMSPSDAEP